MLQYSSQGGRLSPSESKRMVKKRFPPLSTCMDVGTDYRECFSTNYGNTTSGKEVPLHNGSLNALIASLSDFFSESKALPSRASFFEESLYGFSVESP